MIQLIKLKYGEVPKDRPPMPGVAYQYERAIHLSDEVISGPVIYPASPKPTGVKYGALKGAGEVAHSLFGGFFSWLSNLFR